MSSLSGLLRRAFSTAARSPPQPPTDVKLSALFKESDLKTLVETFKKLSANERFRNNTTMYEHTVRRLARAKRFKLVEEILEEQKKYKDISKEGFAARLIHLYGKCGMFDHAVKVFDEMPERNCERTVKSFNALLGACVNSKKFDMIDGFFRDLPGKLSLKPDLVSYNTVIKAFCEMGSLDSALSMVDEMKNNGLSPDLYTFNTLLDGFYRTNMFSEGEKIWSEMIECGVIPDILSYNAKLDGLVSENNVQGAIDLFKEMKIKGLKPDVFSYNSLIRGSCKDGNLEEAKRWYLELEKNQCKANHLSFSVLLPFVCEKGDFEFGFELCKELVCQKWYVDGELIQKVVDGLVKESKIEEAKKLVQLGHSSKVTHYHKLKMPAEV